MRNIPRFSLLVITLAFSATFATAQETSPQPSPAPPAEAKQQAAQPETASKPTETPAADKPATSRGPAPTIYFYRIKQFAGSSLEPSVYCDEKELARMDNGR